MPFLFIVVEGDLLTAYFQSVGNLNFVGGSNTLTHISKFISDLQEHIDFSPGDDSTSQINSNSFNDRMYLGNLLAAVQNEAVQTIVANSNVRNSNISKCVREIFKV